MNDKDNALVQWSATNYIGERYDDYYIVYTRNRDSPMLHEHNFDAALKRLGGESETVIVARASHWLCGWVEQLLVHKSDSNAIRIGNEIVKELLDVGVLNPDAYEEMIASEREQRRKEIEDNPELEDRDGLIKLYGSIERYLELQVL